MRRAAQPSLSFDLGPRHRDTRVAGQTLGREESGETKFFRTNSQKSIFHSTRPRRARLQIHEHGYHRRRVSIHAPVRGATGVFFMPPTARWGFNPHARAGRDLPPPHPRRQRAVSIHAPVRGATADGGQRDGLACVSIHAPVRGATIQDVHVEPVVRVSIHAPVRGATARSVTHPSDSACFNPRARAGRDYGPSKTRSAASRFQSTRPCGARQANKPTSSDRSRFNPRARAGRDPFREMIQKLGLPFQSTRPCGARQRYTYIPTIDVQFQSTRPCGARRISRRTPAVERLFQSTRPCGARHTAAAIALGRTCFNPRARAGRDDSVPETGTWLLQFQSTRPCGARRGWCCSPRWPGPCFNPRARAGRDLTIIP